MNIHIDHVTIGGSDLHLMEDAFAAAGLKTDFGGPHSNNVTHMSLLGFDDGSYIELISTVEKEQASTWWNPQIAEDGGPCAWCARVEGLEEESERLRRLGIPVEGPNYMFRDRPDGKRVEWDLAFPGEQQKGAVLPFLIEDRTPREYRVVPSESVQGSCLTGVAAVLIGVESIEETAKLFQTLYGWDEPKFEGDTNDSVRRAFFPRTPVILEESSTAGGWLNERLEQFGPCPSGYLIRTRDMDEAGELCPLLPREEFCDSSVSWIDPAMISNLRLGVTPASRAHRGRPA